MPRSSRLHPLLFALLLSGSASALAAPGSPPVVVGPFSPYMQQLPAYVQMEFREFPNNLIAMPQLQLPPLPHLDINMFLGSSWRMNDGYGVWSGDGESPLATPKDIARYDKAQTKLYLQNEAALAKFNTAFAAALKAFATAYTASVKKLVRQNAEYQDILLTYPEAVNKPFVIFYLSSRDIALGQAERYWRSAVAHTKQELRRTLGKDLEYLQAYYVTSSLDGYTKKMYGNLVPAERDQLNEAWAPLLQEPLEPIRAYEKTELTVPEAEKMTWGVPPTAKQNSAAANLTAPGVHESSTVPGSATEAGQPPAIAVRHTFLTDALAGLVLFALTLFGLLRWSRRRHKPDTSQREQSGD